MAFLGPLISAGSSLLGGILGNNKEEKLAKQNIAMQREFAQNGIRWKVADAKAAGLHPLAALGAQTTSFSNVVGGSSLASGLAAAGSDIGRAVDATRTAGERADAFTKTMQQLQLQRAGLENDLLASQVAKVRGAGNPPPMPTPGDRYLMEGQANSPLVKTLPVTRQASDPVLQSQEAAAVPDVGFTRTPTGWAPVMSKDVMDRMEEDFLGTLAWNIRNRLMPAISTYSQNPPNVPIEADEYWLYDPLRNEYRRKRRGRDPWTAPYQ